MMVFESWAARVRCLGRVYIYIQLIEKGA